MALNNGIVNMGSIPTWLAGVTRPSSGAAVGAMWINATMTQLSRWNGSAWVDYLSSGAVPTSRTLTIGGITQDLSANRTWSNLVVTSTTLTIGGVTQDLSTNRT